MNWSVWVQCNPGSPAWYGGRAACPAISAAAATVEGLEAKREDAKIAKVEIVGGPVG
jgi:hypothetical protein